MCLFYVLTRLQSLLALTFWSVLFVFRSLANNNIKFLPRELFSDLDSLIEL